MSREGEGRWKGEMKGGKGEGREREEREKVGICPFKQWSIRFPTYFVHFDNDSPFMGEDAFVICLYCMYV